MTATERAMAREEWDRIAELEDRVTIDDALLGTLQDRIRELGDDIKRWERRFDAWQSWQCFELSEHTMREALTEIRDACEPADPIFHTAAAALAAASDEIRDTPEEGTR